MNISNAPALLWNGRHKLTPATLCIVDAVPGSASALPGHSHYSRTQPAIMWRRPASWPRSLRIVRWRNTRSSTRSMASITPIWGYGTAEHIDALRRFGPTPEHQHRFYSRKFLERRRARKRWHCCFFAGGSGSLWGQQVFFCDSPRGQGIFQQKRQCVSFFLSNYE